MQEQFSDLNPQPEYTAEQLNESFPSIDLAYPIAVASYEVATKRLDAMDGRIQTILTFIISISVLFPTIADRRGISFHSWWFYGAALLAAGTVILGTIGRLRGKVRVMSPTDLFEGWLKKPDGEFKKDFIAFAGDDFDMNLRQVDLKWKFCVWITCLAFCQVGLLVAWMCLAPA